MENYMIIAKDRSTEYSIIRAAGSSESECHAAEELQTFIYKMSGACLPIAVTDNVPERAICIGAGAAQSVGVYIGDEVGDEGFIIRTYGERLIIAGGAMRGTLYGVYTFLETCGCRWYSSTVEHIPCKKVLKIAETSIKQIPKLEYRETYYADAMDGDWAARQKNNGNFVRSGNKHGGNVSYYPFVHTFDSLISPKDYFEQHPEYFSEINGERISKQTQLCLTNPDVVSLAKKKVRQWINENPQASIISVSQNDWYNFCTCKNCAALDEKEGTHAASLIAFVNQIAEDIEEDYPNVIIDTLAYQYSRPAPKTLRPNKNVCVRLCSIECCFAHPLECCNYVASFRDKPHGDSFQFDLEGWKKVCNRIYVWDYVVNFSHLSMPFPNFHVLQPNIQYLIKNNVKGIFEEGSTCKSGHSEFAELRAYVLAKLMWNADEDVDMLIDEFMTGFYGKAAPYIRAYFNLIHNQVAKHPQMHFGIYDPPMTEYLPSEILLRCNEFFNKAEAVAENDDVLLRVCTARLSLRYWELMFMPIDTVGRDLLIEQLFNDFDRFNVKEVWEGRMNEHARERMKQQLVRRWS